MIRAAFVSAALVLSGCSFFSGPVGSVSETREARDWSKLGVVPPASDGERRRVTRRLAKMTRRDQSIRNEYVAALARRDREAAQPVNDEIRDEAAEIDRRNLEEFSGYVERFGWFPSTIWGAAASSDAWLLAQHADRDAAFQERVLRTMKSLAEIEEVRPKQVAYLQDRVDVAQGRPQTFGTQGRCVKAGVWKPYPLVNEPDVDALRRSVGLQPLEAYAFESAARCGGAD